MARRPHPARPAIAAIAALDDDLRRAMYEFVRGAEHPVTRQEVAGAVGISRKLAAFHLDKLVDAGLLRARPAPLSGLRRVGRRPTVYEPAGTDIRVAIPERRHDTLATVLVDAVLDERHGESARQTAFRVAREHGRQEGRGLREPAGPLGDDDLLTHAHAVLERYGFEPVAQETAGCVLLRNCPFHPFAERAPELVCGINHAFLSGLLDGLRADTVEAVLVPHTGRCCVELRSAAPPHGTGKPSE